MINRTFQAILVTGGAGFIGSNFIRHLLTENRFQGKIINLDKLTYAGNAASLADIENRFPDRYTFVRGDICDREGVNDLLAQHRIDGIVHFAAESHVDRSISGPDEFIRTNVIGTTTLLEAARNFWGKREDVLFHHVSTDEVFGSLGKSGKFTETTPYDPRSPYSASKAGSDHLVRAWYHTFGLPVTVSNCSNNYGPFQFPEKLIPLMLLRALEGKTLPVYGDGQNVRDWLHVEDHARAILQIIRHGRAGGTWNIGGNNEIRNIDLVNLLCDTLAKITKKDPDTYRQLITFVQDRPGHDQRYAIDTSFIDKDLKWQPAMHFQDGLEKTISWYLDNQEWIQSIQSGEYRTWIEKQY